MSHQTSKRGNHPFPLNMSHGDNPDSSPKNQMRQMRTKYAVFLTSLIAVVASAPILSAQVAGDPPPSSVSISVFATMAPNGDGSPSYVSWATNGIYALENGLISYGPAGPTQFNITSAPLPLTDNVVTGFPSWMGQANPSAPYDQEYGTRASFAVVFNGNGSLITVDDIGAFGTTNDNNALGFDFPENSILSGDWSYSYRRIGIVYNNNVDTSGGVTTVTSGDGLVNEILYVGAGDSFPAYLGDDPNPGATDQDIINYDLSAAGPWGLIGPYNFTGTFTYGDPNVNGIYTDSASATFVFTSAPDGGSTLLLLGLGLAGLGVLGLRRNRLESTK